MLYLIATELTLPRLLWRAMVRRPTCVIEARTIVQGGPGIIGRLVDRLRAGGRVSTLADHPQLRSYVDVGDFLRLEDPFAENEAWMDHRFGFDDSDARFGRDALAYRHVLCMDAFSRYWRGAAVRTALIEGKVAGLDGVDADLARRQGGDGAKIIDTCRLAERLLGGVIFLLACLRCWAWIVAHIRLSVPSPRPFFLASDYLGGDRDLLLWRELCDDTSQTLVVFREKATIGDYGGMVTGWPQAMPTDGVFSLKDGLRILAEAARDYWRLYRGACALPPDMVRSLMTIPWKRAVYRAFFNRYRPRFYWGRDDYNVDHILRSQELRAVGGVSIGIMHGLPNIVTVSHQIRYVDFDVYYTHGTALYQERYKSRWPHGMTVRPVGSVGLSRDELAALAQPVPLDVAFILGPSFHQDQVIQAVGDLARAFPDRTIWINTKTSYRSRGSFGQAFQSILDLNLPNIREFQGRTYDLFYRTTYWISESSTLVAEAVQFGRVGLCIDPDARFKYLFYRRYPWLMVRDGADLVQRIHDLESGQAVYPRAQAHDMIRMDGLDCWDIIRADLGLPPRDCQPAAHLAFAPPSATPLETP